MDDLSIIVSKKVEGQCYKISEQEEDKLKDNFEYVALWNKEYCLRFNRRFEILGLPLQFCEDGFIRKIGRSWV